MSQAALISLITNAVNGTVNTVAEVQELLLANPEKLSAEKQLTRIHYVSVLHPQIIALTQH